MDLTYYCDTVPVIYMSLNPTCHFLVAAFKMCKFIISTYRYRHCTLLQYHSGLGRTVQPHTIRIKYIHQCENPKPESGSNDIYCDERLHTERVQVQDPGDRGHTMVNGDCPACKAAEEKCSEVFIVNYMCYTTGCTYH